MLYDYQRRIFRIYVYDYFLDVMSMIPTVAILEINTSNIRHIEVVSKYDHGDVP
jgi:hypothetical protein